MSASGPSCPLVYLSHGLVRVCEIELSHMGKNNGNPDLVCEKIWYILLFIRFNKFLEL